MSGHEQHRISIISAICGMLFGSLIYWLIATYWPARTVVEFQGTPIVDPVEAVPGGPLVVFYQIRRNESCTLTLRPRFYNLDRGAFDADVQRAATEVASARNNAFGPFVLQITIPETIYPGHWGYWPLVEPGDDCESQEIVEAPIAAFTVREGATCDRVRASASGLYHVPRSRWYDRVTSPVGCFATPAEAEENGFVRATQ